MFVCFDITTYYYLYVTSPSSLLKLIGIHSKINYYFDYLLSTIITTVAFYFIDFNINSIYNIPEFFPTLFCYLLHFQTLNMDFSFTGLIHIDNVYISFASDLALEDSFDIYIKVIHQSYLFYLHGFLTANDVNPLHSRFQKNLHFSNCFAQHLSVLVFSILGQKNFQMKRFKIE